MTKKEKFDIKLLWNHVIKNWHMWLVLCATIFVSMLRSALSVSWAGIYLSEQGYFLPMFEEDLLSWWYNYLFYACLFLGIVVSCWCSDKLYFGTRWFTNILFQTGLMCLVLFFWLIPGNIIVVCYPYLMIGMTFLAGGSLVAIFVAALELVHKKIIALSIGVILAFMYVADIFSSNMLNGIMIEYLGWHGYFITLLLCSSLYLWVLWHYRPRLQSKSV